MTCTEIMKRYQSNPKMASYFSGKGKDDVYYLMTVIWPDARRSELHRAAAVIAKINGGLK